MKTYNSIPLYLQLYDKSKNLPTSTHSLIVPTVNRFFCKLADYTGELPDDFYLSGSILISQDFKQGGYADVTRGMFDDTSVAVKRFRGYNMISFDTKREKWKRVSSACIYGI
jgi:hypothetical protein